MREGAREEEEAKHVQKTKLETKMELKVVGKVKVQT